MIRPIVRRRLTAAGAGLLLITGGSRSFGAAAAPAAQAGATFEACSLLTKAEVDAGTKLVAAAAVKGQTANMRSCTFGNPKDATSPILVLNVLVTASSADAKKAHAIAKSNAADVAPVAGLGDEAYFDKYLHTLRVVKGRYAVDLVLDSSAGGVTEAKALAAKALPRLP